MEVNAKTTGAQVESMKLVSMTCEEDESSKAKENFCVNIDVTVKAAASPARSDSETFSEKEVEEFLASGPSSSNMFLDSALETNYLRRRGDALLQGLLEARTEIEGLHEAGLRLQQAHEALQLQVREMTGDIAYWKALAEARGEELALLRSVPSPSPLPSGLGDGSLSPLQEGEEEDEASPTPKKASMQMRPVSAGPQASARAAWEEPGAAVFKAYHEQYIGKLNSSWLNRAPVSWGTAPATTRSWLGAADAVQVERAHQAEEHELLRSPGPSPGLAYTGLAHRSPASSRTSSAGPLACQQSSGTAPAMRRTSSAGGRASMASLGRPNRLSAAFRAQIGERARSPSGRDDARSPGRALLGSSRFMQVPQMPRLEEEPKAPAIVIGPICGVRRSLYPSLASVGGQTPAAQPEAAAMPVRTSRWGPGSAPRVCPRLGTPTRRVSKK